MSQVTRIVHRRANPGQERQYEHLARGMLEACSRSPGYLFSTLIPPRVEDEEFHIVQCFTDREALDLWRHSEAADDWHARLRHVSDHDPEYRVFDTADLWFSATGLRGEKQPARWRMAFVTWMGIFPTATVAVGGLFPFLSGVPFVVRMLVVTAVVVLFMYWILMPRLLRWMAWWLKRK